MAYTEKEPTSDRPTPVSETSYQGSEKFKRLFQRIHVFSSLGYPASITYWSYIGGKYFTDKIIIGKIFGNNIYPQNFCTQNLLVPDKINETE